LRPTGTSEEEAAADEIGNDPFRASRRHHL